MREDARERRPNLTDSEREALGRTILAAVHAEPGEWTAAELAHDLDVSVSTLRRVLHTLPHRYVGWGPAAKLWPGRSM